MPYAGSRACAVRSFLSSQYPHDGMPQGRPFAGFFQGLSLYRKTRCVSRQRSCQRVVKMSCTSAVIGTTCGSPFWSHEVGTVAASCPRQSIPASVTRRVNDCYASTMCGPLLHIVWPHLATRRFRGFFEWGQETSAVFSCSICPKSRSRRSNSSIAACTVGNIRENRSFNGSLTLGISRSKANKSARS